MKLLDIITDIHNANIKGDASIDISGIAYDSRSVSKGCVFVCIKGYSTDGHDYINDAIRRGAVAVVVQQDTEVPEGITLIKAEDTRHALAFMSRAFFGYPSKNIKLIGVTGTNGKTTTTYLIKSILEVSGFSTALLGTISNIVGGKAVEASRTTPESYDLQQMLKEMADVKTDYCIMEVSSHSLELKRVAGCTFNVGIYTNLTRDHLDFHGTFENYLKAKMKLFDISKTAAVNIDDEYSSEVLKGIKIPVISYSVDGGSDVRAVDVEITSKDSRFTLIYMDKMIPVVLPLPGRFNVYNALAAACACLAEGISLENIKMGLECCMGIPGRSEVIDSGRGFTIIIDYAHTPDGLENILNTVKEYAQGRIITIFGCGGDRDKTKRPLMGETAGTLSDICIVTSDNPRSEEPMAIIEDILPGVKNSSSNYRVIVDRKEAIKTAISIAQKGDVVVIAGKGHETYQILKDRTIHFDEREIVADILKTM